MDYANDNHAPEVGRNLRNYAILGGALLVSGTLWFVMGPWVWLSAVSTHETDWVG
jgi:hypothetical protein